MMGMQVAPAQLFYDFCLDDHVPADHLLRRIDRILDLESVRTALSPFYSSIGRPSVDPELMMRMLIVGYGMGLRSERRLCEEVHLNLAYRSFCRLAERLAGAPTPKFLIDLPIGEGGMIIVAPAQHLIPLRGDSEPAKLGLRRFAERIFGDVTAALLVFQILNALHTIYSWNREPRHKFLT